MRASFLYRGLRSGRAGAFAIAGAALVLACTNAPRHSGFHSDHFDGERFKNLVVPENRNLWDVLRWKLGVDESVEWPEWIETPKYPPPPARVEQGLRVTFVNHATLLVQLDGVNVLTDPVWSDRVGPASWLGPKRHKAPGIAFDELPKIDAIVLSHNHYDHFDAPTLHRIVARDMPVVLGGLGTAGLLAALDLGHAHVTELDWWDRRRVRDVTIVFAPAQHGSQRTATDRDHTLWGSFFVQGSRASAYFAGDTAAGPHFRMVRERLGRPTVALLPIGAYKPRWFMKPLHVDPHEAVEAHRQLEAAYSVGMHWGTFDQADEAVDDPIDDLAIARTALGVGKNEFVALENGQSLVFPAFGPPSR